MKPALIRVWKHYPFNRAFILLLFHTPLSPLSPLSAMSLPHISEVIKKLKEPTELTKKYSHSINAYKARLYHYLKWNQKNDSQIDKGSSFDWYKVFKAESYLTYKPTIDGYSFPSIPIATGRIFESSIDKRFESLNSFISEAKLNEKSEYIAMIELEAYRSAILSQINNQIDLMERIDVEIQSVMKVFIWESQNEIFKCWQGEENIKKKDSHLGNLVSDCVDLYWNVRQRSDLVDASLSSVTNREYVLPDIGRSLIHGVTYLQLRKESYITPLIPLIEKLIHTENVKRRIIMGIPLLDRITDLPVVQNEYDEKIELLARVVSGRKANENICYQFLLEYGKLRKDMKNLKKTKKNLMDEIFSTNENLGFIDRIQTYYKWIEQFDEEAKTLNIVLPVS